MRIALFASAFYPHVGGVEELVRQLAHAFRDKGFPAIVLTNRWPRSLPRYEEYEGIPVYRLAMRVPEGSLKARVSHMLTHDAIREGMFGILREHGINVLQVHCISANGYYALLARRRFDLPLVISTHGERTIDVGRLYQTSPFANRILRQLLAEADAVTACSKASLDDMEQYWGKPLGARGRVVYNGIAVGDFDRGGVFPHPRPYILAIGRLVEQKGFDLLLRAFARAQISTHDLLIAGEGPQRASLDRLIRELGLGGRAMMLGRADRPMAVALFKGCSFFCLPSRDEPLGIVNLEAMISGKAVLATRVGGVPELVSDGDTGLLIPPLDIDALARGLTRLAGDPALCQRLGDAGQRRALQFTWPAVADEYLQIYRSLGVSAATAFDPPPSLGERILPGPAGLIEKSACQPLPTSQS